MARKKSLSHVDGAGRLRKVDVTGKRSTLRRARASCVVHMVVDIGALGLRSDGVDTLHALRLAGLQAVKQTATLR
jgi:molybdenum cofactor biosynthesis enzyme